MSTTGDEARKVFGERLRDMLTGHVLTMLISVGYRTGLFEAAAMGPATGAELARRAGLDERHVREWLGTMVTGEIIGFEPGTGRYTLPPVHAALLTGARAANAGPAADMLRTLALMLPAVEEAFRTGAGVPYAQYAAVAGDSLGRTWRHVYDEHLVDGFLGRVPGLCDRLTRGARVLDLGCGTGRAVTVMARAFPASTFLGLDIASEAIAVAEAELAGSGVENASFVVADAAELAIDPAFDLITAFDAVHDQRAPETVLRRVHDALVPGGVFVMIDVAASSRLEDDLGDPYAALGYGISTLFCVPTTRAGGGPALGAMWGRERACRMLADAGFADVEVLDSPRPQNWIYVCRPGR